jgi:hypothetical protein
VGTSIVITMHGETVSTVRTVHMSTDDDRLTSLKLGDDRSGITLLGHLDDVRRLIEQASGQLRRIADKGPGNGRRVGPEP